MLLILIHLERGEGERERERERGREREKRYVLGENVCMLDQYVCKHDSDHNPPI